MGIMGRVAGVCVATMLAPMSVCIAAVPGVGFSGHIPVQTTDDPMALPGLSLRQVPLPHGSLIEPPSSHRGVGPDTSDGAPRLSAARNVVHDTGTARFNGGDGHASANRNSRDAAGVQPTLLQGAKAVAPSNVTSQDEERGLKVRGLTDRERAEFGVAKGGVIVVSVGQGAALEAGFKQGDVVLMLDGVSLNSAAQFRELLRSLPHDRPVPVLVHRPNNNLFLPLAAHSR